jgi:hypothetical protein
MTSKKFLAAFALATALTAAAAPFAVAAEGSNVATTETKSGEEAAKLLELSRQLVEYGRKNNDPLSLIVAAGMRQQVGLDKADRKPDDPKDAAEGEPLTVAAILDEAKTLSGGDETIVAMADDVAAAATKGRTVGPGYNIVNLPGNSQDTYSNVSFDGGVYAEVYTEGSGNTNLDLFVYDENGNLICSDTDPSDINYCGWTPSWTGPFTIKVVNYGGSTNTYALITN